jgi:hypothetical protein
MESVVVGRQDIMTASLYCRGERVGVELITPHFSSSILLGGGSQARTRWRCVYSSVRRRLRYIRRIHEIEAELARLRALRGYEIGR